MSAENVNEQSRNRLTRAASFASLAVAITLVAAKLWAWQATGAVSLLSSLVDSLLDVITSGITVVAIRYALTPADREHRFGHGKSEGLAALAQSVIIAGSAVFVCVKAIDRLQAPEPLNQPVAGIAVALGSILLTLVLIGFQKFVVRRTGSVAIAADALHYQTDTLVNLSVAVAIPIAAWTSWTMVDPLTGIGIAAYILWATYRIARQSLDILLDHEIPEADRQVIREVATKHPSVLGFHDLRTRSSGASYIIQFHLELDPLTSLLDAHLVMDEVELEIRQRFPGCEIIVHTDPLGLPERRDSFE